MSDINPPPKQSLPKFVIPTGAARFFPPRRIAARRAAEWRDLSASLGGRTFMSDIQALQKTKTLQTPCSSSSLCLFRGSDIHVRHTSTPKNKNSPNSPCLLASCSPLATSVPPRRHRSLFSSAPEARQTLAQPVRAGKRKQNKPSPISPFSRLPPHCHPEQREGSLRLFRGSDIHVRHKPTPKT